MLLLSNARGFITFVYRITFGSSRSTFVLLLVDMCFVREREISQTKPNTIMLENIPALIPYTGDLNHCRNCTPASEDGLK
jgi:hypothetical protein